MFYRVEKSQVLLCLEGDQTRDRAAAPGTEVKFELISRDDGTQPRKSLTLRICLPAALE